MTTARLRRGQSVQVADCEKVGGLPSSTDSVRVTVHGLVTGVPGTGTVCVAADAIPAMPTMKADTRTGTAIT